MTTFIRRETRLAHDLAPGEYLQVAPLGRRSDRLVLAVVCCPECKRASTVGVNHKVSAAGAVTPSYVCPFPPCTFHTGIELADWR